MEEKEGALGFATRAVHVGNDVDKDSGAIKRPITMANSYALPYDPTDMNWSSAGANPFEEMERADNFKALSIPLDAPNGAEEVSYFIIDGEIAEIRFTLDGKSYLACATAQTGDFSGLYGQESDPETVDAATNAVLVSVDTDTAVYQKITWTDGIINYCLYGTDGADRNQVLAAYEALKK